jgi:anaerobic magnesium-protoporphyrin IX monomethyl ester cyclase
MKKNILFVNLLSTPIDSILESFEEKNLVIQEIVMPLGLMYLSSYIKKYDQDILGEVGLIDYTVFAREIPTYQTLNNFLIMIAKQSTNFIPDILAFSLNLSTSHHFFLTCAELLKKIWPDAIVVVGGVHATNYTYPLLQTGLIDYIFRGEAEIAFSKFIRAAADDKPGQSDIKGLYGRGIARDEETCLELCDYIEDLDLIPFPDWDLINMDFYLTHISRFPKKDLRQDRQSKMAEIFTTRGCPFSCTFCSAHTVHGRKVRYRSVENVLDEIKFLNERYGVNTFFPEDDLFTVQKPRTLNLLNGIRGLNISTFDMQFPNGLSINTLDEELLDALIQVGMKIATLAIESGCEFVQKNIIHKRVNLQKAIKLVDLVHRKGIQVRCYFILGFPGETKEQMLESISFAKSLKADWYDFFVATPLVGSEMYAQFLEMGYITDDSNIWRSSFFWRRQFDTKEITAIDLNRMTYEANLQLNFLNNTNLVEGNYSRALELYNSVLSKYPFHIIGWYCAAECYRKMNDPDKVSEIIQKIDDLIERDSRAAAMYNEYKELMPLFQYKKML